MSRVLPVSTLVTGVTAWFLAECRHVAGKRVQIDVLPGRRLRVTSDAPGISAAPLRKDASLDTILSQRAWGFTDGRIDWPDALAACSEWELVLPRKGGSTIVEGMGARVLSKKDVARPEPGARFTFTPDTLATSGAFDAPETLAELYQQALRWPDVKLTIKLPEFERWKQATLPSGPPPEPGIQR